MGIIVCPVCNLNDKIERVEGIVARDTTEMQMSGPTGAVFNVGGDWGGGGGWTKLTGVQVTNLAKSLAPPPDPREGAGFGCWAWSCAGVSVVMAGVPGIVLIVLLADGDLSGPSGPGAFITLLGTAAAFVLVPILVVAGHLYRKEKASTKVPAWKAAMADWGRTYYCERDHIVFDPEAVETKALAEPTPAQTKPPEHFA